MGKPKKKGLVDKVRNKKSQTRDKVNPFEIKINRQKHSILGKKLAKHDKGTPGVSRSRAIKKRKETLLQEYKTEGKANKFVDRRFGEHDTDMSLEDKMLKRFAIERQKTSEKPSLFNLNEDEDLTHYGQSLSSIEKFEEPKIDSDEDDEDEDQGRIGAQQVSEEHFGGFMRKKTDEETATSWKERMEEMIAKSKKEKYERQHEKEITQVLTEKLDEEWKTMYSLMSSSKKTKSDPEPEKTKIDDYDKTVRELQFELKGKASDRLKTEEEMAAEEKAKLEKLEEDRLRRMKGIMDDSSHKKSVNFSADSLEDNLDVEKERFHVSYKDGKMLSEDKDGYNDEQSNTDEDNVSDNDDSSDDGDDDNADSYSDLEDDENCDDGSDDENHIQNNRENVSKLSNDIMVEAQKELPYIFKLPRCYEDFVNFLSIHSDTDQLTVIERLRKCHHPSLAEGNKSKLEIIFRYLLDYIGDLALKEPVKSDLINKLIKPIYEMCQASPLTSGMTVLEIVKEKQDTFSQYAQMKNGRGSYPGLDTLLLFKIISTLFPTSDFKHPVTSPAMLFMGQTLAQYVQSSKRYVPEALNFLLGILYMASTKTSNKIETLPPPFKSVGRGTDLLELKEGLCNKVDVKPLNLTVVLSCTDLRKLDADYYRVNFLVIGFRLLGEFSKLYEALPSFSEIFQPFLPILSKIPLRKYPQIVKDMHLKFEAHYKEHSAKSRSFLMRSKKKPQPLKLYEPKFSESFDGKKKRGGSRDFQEKQRLIHKHKKELKGAMREVRKDAQFLARVKHEENMKKDADRKRKVKQVYAMLADQEGDYNEMKRKKNRL